MEQIRNLYVGFDLGNENSQISCFHPRTGEIETIGGKPNDNYCFIPTCLACSTIAGNACSNIAGNAYSTMAGNAYSTTAGNTHSTTTAGKQKKEWFYGEEALLAAKEGKAELIDNFVSRISKGELLSVLGTSFEAAALLEKFFRKTLVLLQKYYSNSYIARLVVTVEEENQTLKTAIQKALENMGILADRALVTNHTQSYVYYALSQKRELWQQDIGLFNFNRRGLFYKKIHINRQYQPLVAACEEVDLSEHLPSGFYEQRENGRGTAVFLETANSVLCHQRIETLYFTGEGFLSNWSDKALQELCAGKRGFRGPNIYTRGAAYQAKDLDSKEFSRKFLFLSEGILRHEILLPAYKDGRMREVRMVTAGEAWKEARGSATILLEDEDEIKLVIRNVLDMTTSERMLSLEGMPAHPKRMARFQLSFYLENSETCVILIRDAGFGEYAPSSKRVWEKRVEL